MKLYLAKTIPKPGTNNRCHIFALWAMACLALLALAGQAKADVLASWETTGLANYGPSPFNPNGTVNPALTVGGLTRGSGFVLSGTAGGNAWGGVNFAGTDAANAVSIGDFGTCTFTANAGKVVSFSGIGAYNIRRSNTGPNSGIWQ